MITIHETPPEARSGFLDGFEVTFACHAGVPGMGTTSGKTVTTGFMKSDAGSVRVPFELAVPAGIRRPGYYSDLGDGGGTLQWQLLCRPGPPVIGYTARFDVPASAGEETR